MKAITIIVAIMFLIGACLAFVYKQYAWAVTDYCCFILAAITVNNLTTKKYK